MAHAAGTLEMIVELTAWMQKRHTVPERGARRWELHRHHRTHKVPFHLDQNASSPVAVVGCIGTRLSLEGLPADSACALQQGAGGPLHWLRFPNVPISPVGIHVQERPSPPSLHLDPVAQKSSPKFKCVSDSDPPATIKWYNSLEISE
ncbi:hypothetical protein N1851_019337 [Merluccius polli]|uniref:Ig-like domain-containing protein n=1 Tax=Merluccius polli TaxID=89951 RepID=A0AA47P0N7_MERPO|nr:hypothetical protein N1851_019337 [Merluccius polli]